MRNIFGRSWLMVLLIAAVVPATAQTKDEKKYIEEADAIRKEVWGWNKPEFAVHTVPAEFANASKVVIARHINVTATGNMRHESVDITRELIKLNDKAAVSDYSELTFTKMRKAAGEWFSTDRTNIYVGVRVIKPDGSMKEVSANDIVLGDGRGKEAKLAIPDLQPGDMIDYFLAKKQNVGATMAPLSSYAFTLFDDAPVLSYSIHMEIRRTYAIEYRCYNGAPDFTKSTNDEKANVLDLSVKNIVPNPESGFWISSYRQLPVIRLNLKFGWGKTLAATGRYYVRAPGVIYQNPPVDEVVRDKETDILEVPGGERGIGGILKDKLFKRYMDLSEHKNKIPADSLAQELYYLYRYAAFLDVPAFGNIDGLADKLKKDNDNDVVAAGLYYLFRTKGLPVEMAQVSGNSNPRFDEIFSPFDFHELGVIRENTDRWFDFNSAFSTPFYIPADYENIKAAPIEETGSRKKHTEQITVDVPGSSAMTNARIETLAIKPAANGTDLEVNRKTVLKGHYKADIQKELILFEDYCNSERKLFGEPRTVIEEFEEVKTRKSYAAELKAAFDKDREKQKDKFVAEAKDWFDQSIIDLTDYKVENLGVRHNDPDFIYSSKFNISGIIKKAGNNMIIDVGKLQGTSLNISPAQRKRKLDIYMPFARSIQWQITLQIPDGYTAEGITELNKKVENETGYFIAEATSGEKTVTIKVKKSYNHSFEPVANWEKMLAFIDAANEWSNAKILLKKK